MSGCLEPTWPHGRGWLGLEKPFSYCTSKYSLKSELLEPPWELWKQLPREGDPLQRAGGSPTVLPN